ncbi:PE family protein [Mycolicibacterium conceptionense]|uniref:PE family protein n=1 Tax=Mycolicibacterium conceptionense TaxID=451644 RepID=UPI003204CDA0
MGELFAQPGALAAASAGTATTAITAEAAAVAEAVPMTAVLPGTASPTVVASTTRIVAHGAQKLAMSTLGAAMVALVAEAYAESGLGYEVMDTTNAATLL